MPRFVNFESLSLKDALDLAILVEEEAKERYGEFVDQMELHHTAEAAKFFRFMVVNESKHEAQLQERRKALFGDTPRTVAREMLWDVEAPDYDQARAFMQPREAMETALLSEEKAHDYFVAALVHVSDPEVRALFEELRDEELQHQMLIRKELAKLPATPTVNPDDWADEPNAQ
jgi:erythrin-vacuolar iron transport family protein